MWLGLKVGGGRPKRESSFFLISDEKNQFGWTLGISWDDLTTNLVRGQGSHFFHGDPLVRSTHFWEDLWFFWMKIILFHYFSARKWTYLCPLFSFFFFSQWARVKGRVLTWSNENGRGMGWGTLRVFNPLCVLSLSILFFPPNLFFFPSCFFEKQIKMKNTTRV